MEAGIRSSLSKLRYHGAVGVSVATVIALCIYPIPFCIDCEFPKPWGHVSVQGEGLVFAWLLIAPVLAGLLALRNGWLVPICAVLALPITQPLGGVAWWSLRDNEGPFILYVGLLAAMACFGIGHLIRIIVVCMKGVMAKP